jgi:hypothetical protein
MPRRSILSASDRDILLALPEGRDELMRHYTFGESDRALTASSILLRHFTVPPP